MLRVGLTGGIAAGKSTVAAMLRERGCPVLPLDPLGHKFLEPGNAAHDEAVREFGAEILGADGAVDRSKLGAIVFADARKRERLNQILHPPILEFTKDWFMSLEKAGGNDVAFVEAALILEAGYDRYLDRVAVCWCRPEQQLERLQRRGLSTEQARQRVAAQMPVDEKRKRADDTIDCSDGLEETERQVQELLGRLRATAAAGRIRD